MKKRLLMFFFVKALNPLFLIAITFILARNLPANDVALFLLLYSMSVIFSAFSDGGSRVSHFAKIRKNKFESKQLLSIYLECIRIKIIFSFLLIPVLILALNFFYDSYGLALVFALWFYSLSMPIGDPAWIVFRGLGDVSIEIKANFLEQISVITGILILISFEYISLINIFFLLAIIGIFRFVYSQIRIIKFLNYQKINIQSVLSSKFMYVLTKQFWTFSSVLISNCFNRLPILLASGFLSSSSFVVFSSFYTLFMRGELLLGATIQAIWGEKNAYNNRRLFYICFFGFLIGCIVLAFCWFFSETIVRIYLGQSYADSSYFLLFPALYMCLYFPFFVYRSHVMFEGQTKIVALSLVFGILVQLLFSKIKLFDGVLTMYSFPISIIAIAFFYYLIRLRRL